LGVTGSSLRIVETPPSIFTAIFTSEKFRFLRKDYA
jgi:hypothetical protein